MVPGQPMYSGKVILCGAPAKLKWAVWAHMGGCMRVHHQFTNTTGSHQIQCKCLTCVASDQVTMWM